MKIQPYWIFLLVFILGCSFVSPLWLNSSTPTPSISPRPVKITHDFPWQESWRLPMLLLGNYQNVRNLIAIKNGAVFMDGWWLKFVYADDGDLQWAVKMEGPIDSIITDEKAVYVVGNTVERYDLQTGKPVWKSKMTLPGHTGYSLQLQDNNLYVYEDIDLVFIFDTEKGELLKKTQTPRIGQKPVSLLQLENEGWLQSDGKQIMLVRNQEVLWQTKLKGLPQKFPVLYQDVLIVRFENDRTVFDGLAGLDLTNGNLIWERPGEFYSNFVVVDNLLYVISKEAKILILDPKSGQTVGSAELLPNNVDTIHPISAISVNNNMMYVHFTDSQEVIAFKKEN